MERHQVWDILSIGFCEYETGLIYSNLTVDLINFKNWLQLTDLNFDFSQIVSHDRTVSGPIEENFHNNQHVLIIYSSTTKHTKI